MVKVSIITVVYNGERFLKDCISSVVGQDYPNIEYILVDGNSTDGSFAIAKSFENQIDVLLSEADQGMYDALNKGIALATGEVIGILNADDVLADETVISAMVKLFDDHTVQGVYGDLNYVSATDLQKIERKWRSQIATSKDLRLGWMPAHPTLYLRSNLFEQFGHYKLNYGSACDYELMLRMFYQHHIKSAYLPKLMVKMRSGGMSNQSWKHRWHAMKFDYQALRDNGVPFALSTLVLKKVRKFKQFF